MKNPPISHERVKSLLAYDDASGIFTWRGRTGSAGAGKRAGRVFKETGRRTIQVDGHHVKSSRLAWFYVHGVWPSGLIDHKDCDVSNDAILNLRDCNSSQNSANARLSKKNTCGLKGVRFHTGHRLYQARITFRGKRQSLGYFQNPQEAHAAYVAKARELFGEFARAA